MRACDDCGTPITSVAYVLQVQQLVINTTTRTGVMNAVGEAVDLNLCTACICGIKNRTPLAILIEQRAQQLDKQRQLNKEHAA
jgi:hypothetical protein